MHANNDLQPPAAQSLNQPAAGGSDETWTRCWVFRRNCSISPRQLMLVFGALSVTSLLVAGTAWMAGGTLVFPFTGLELVALAVAMLVYARHATDRESVRLSPDRLQVEWENAGVVESVQFNPRWVRLSQLEGGLIELSSSGRTFYIGRYVRPERREVMLRDLRAALRAI